MPKEGIGFNTYAQSGNVFVTPGIASILIGTSYEWNKDYGGTVSFGDASNSLGVMPWGHVGTEGDWWDYVLSGGLGHTYGKNIDVRLFDHNGNGFRGTYLDPEFCLGYTGMYVERMTKAGVGSILGPKSGIIPGTTPYPKHNNHLHLQSIRPK